MEEEKFSLSGTFQKGKEYVDTQIKLLQMKSLAKGSKILGSLILVIVNVVFSLFIVFFCSLALGFYLGELLESNALGFLLTGVVFFILVLLIQSFRPALKKGFMNIIIRNVVAKWQEEDEEETKQEEIKSVVDEEFTENK